MSSLSRHARLSGLLYLLVVVTAPIGLIWAPGRLIVPGDASATAANIRAESWVLHLGMAADLVHQLIFCFAVLALFELFEPVSRTLARQLIVFGILLSVPIVFGNVLNQVAAEVLAVGEQWLAPFDRSQLDALCYLFLRMHARGTSLASIFWGVWLVPFGILVARSRWFPRVLGYMLIVAGAAIVFGAFTRLVLPQWSDAVSRIAMPLQLLELPIVFWMVIRGARPREGPVT